MPELLAKIIPLDLASTLSPIILALAITLLAKKDYGLAKVLAMGVGSLIVAIILAILGLKIGINIQDVHNNRLIDNITDLILAAIFLYFGIASLLHKDDNKQANKIEENPSGHLLKWLGIGFLISATNFDAVLLNFSAAKEIGQAQIAEFNKIILLVVGVIFFVLPILLPVVIYLLVPKLADKILAPLDQFLTKYGRYIAAVIFIVFAVYLSYQGLKNL